MIRLFGVYKDQLGAATIATEMTKLDTLTEILTTDPEFLSLYFGKLSESFPTYSKEILDGLLSMRTDLSKSQRKDILADLTSNADTINFLQAPESEDRKNQVQRVEALVQQSQRDDPDKVAPKTSAGGFLNFLWSGGSKNTTTTSSSAGSASPPVAAATSPKQSPAASGAPGPTADLSLGDFLD